MVIRRFSPIQLLIFGFILVIVTSAALLSLPASSSRGVRSSYLDALFTATSAVTTTGLAIFDTGSYYNTLGQMVIVFLMQIGGLGYMVLLVLLFIALGRRISFRGFMMLEESIKKPPKVNAIHFAKIVILYTAVIETAGCGLLALFFTHVFPWRHALFSAFFHSISAFNTAGFSLYADSFCRFAGHLAINLSLIVITSLGAIGFFVLYDLALRISPRKRKGGKHALSVHSRIMIIFTCIILIFGTIVLFFSENGNSSLPLKERMLSSLFQVSSASSTTGFNSMDIGRMRSSSLFLILIMMYIGAGAGSTGGGIKITTFVVILAYVFSIIRGSPNANILHRRIPADIIKNSLSIALLALLWIFFATQILLISENFSFMQIMFEVTSAIGTVGLSTGITPQLSEIGKWIIIITMLIGRIGPLGIGISLFQKRKNPDYQYPTMDIFVG